jgi:hypothetical protein
MSFESFRPNPTVSTIGASGPLLPQLRGSCLLLLSSSSSSSPSGTKAGSTMPRKRSVAQLIPRSVFSQSHFEGLPGLGGVAPGACARGSRRIRGATSSVGGCYGSSVVRVALRLGVCLLPSDLYGTAGITPWVCLFFEQQCRNARTDREDGPVGC